MATAWDRWRADSTLPKFPALCPACKSEVGVYHLNIETKAAIFLCRDEYGKKCFWPADRTKPDGYFGQSDVDLFYEVLVEQEAEVSDPDEDDALETALEADEDEGISGMEGSPKATERASSKEPANDDDENLREAEDSSPRDQKDIDRSIRSSNHDDAEDMSDTSLAFSLEDDDMVCENEIRLKKSPQSKVYGPPRSNAFELHSLSIRLSMLSGLPIQVTANVGHNVPASRLGVRAMASRASAKLMSVFSKRNGRFLKLMAKMDSELKDDLDFIRRVQESLGLPAGTTVEIDGVGKNEDLICLEDSEGLQFKEFEAIDSTLSNPELASPLPTSEPCVSVTAAEPLKNVPNALSKALLAGGVLEDLDFVNSFENMLVKMAEGFQMPATWNSFGLDPVVAILVARKFDPEFAGIDFNALLQLYAGILISEKYERDCQPSPRKTKSPRKRKRIDQEVSPGSAKRAKGGKNSRLVHPNDKSAAAESTMHSAGDNNSSSTALPSKEARGSGETEVDMEKVPEEASEGPLVDSESPAKPSTWNCAIKSNASQNVEQQSESAKKKKYYGYGQRPPDSNQDLGSPAKAPNLNLTFNANTSTNGGGENESRNAEQELESAKKEDPCGNGERPTEPEPPSKMSKKMRSALSASQLFVRSDVESKMKRFLSFKKKRNAKLEKETRERSPKTLWTFFQESAVVKASIGPTNDVVEDHVVPVAFVSEPLRRRRAAQSSLEEKNLISELFKVADDLFSDSEINK